MSKFQHLRSPATPGDWNQYSLTFVNGVWGVWEFVSCTPGAPGARQLVDKSVDNVDNWEFGEFGSLTRGLTDMTTMPLYQVSSPLEYLCSNCGKDHASGQFLNCSAKRETELSFLVQEASVQPKSLCLVQEESVQLYFYSHYTTNPKRNQ